MENNNIKNEIVEGSSRRTSGTGALSAIIFAVVVTILLSIAAHFVG